MEEYQHVMVLKTRQPLLWIKLNFDSRKFSEKRTTPDSFIECSVLKNSNC